MVKRYMFLFSQDKGISANTRFQMQCTGWYDVDPPLRYEFRYKLESQKYVHISSASENYILWDEGRVSTSKPSVLPSGDPKFGDKVKFKTRIINSYGAFIEVNSAPFAVSNLSLFHSTVY